MGNRQAKTHPITSDLPKQPKTKHEFLQNAIDSIEKVLGIGQPACASIPSIEEKTSRSIPLKPNHLK